MITPRALFGRCRSAIRDPKYGRCTTGFGTEFALGLQAEAKQTMISLDCSAFPMGAVPVVRRMVTFS